MGAREREKRREGGSRTKAEVQQITKSRDRVQGFICSLKDEATKLKNMGDCSLFPEVVNQDFLDGLIHKKRKELQQMAKALGIKANQTVAPLSFTIDLDF